MAFDERIRKAIFTSPGGVSLELQFDTVERSGGKKVPTHEYPFQDRFDVQDLGLQADRFPFACYFTGAQHDRKAKELREALSEKVTQDRPAKFQHPRYGNIDVIAISWGEKEDLVGGVGRTDFTIEFLKVFPKALFPITSVATSQKIKSLSENTQADINARAVEKFNPADASDLANVKEQVAGWKVSAQAALSKVFAISEEVQAESDRLFRAIDNKIDEISSDPSAVFNDIVEIYNLAADVDASIREKVDGFRDHINALRERAVDTVTQAETILQQITGVLTAVARCIGTGRNKDRADAVATSDEIDEITEAVLETIEAAEASVDGFSADPEILIQISEQLTLVKEELVTRAFDLRAEKRYTLSTEQTPIDLFYSLVGTLDGLEEFMNQNDFQGDEIILVKTGREVIYYG